MSVSRRRSIVPLTCLLAMSCVARVLAQFGDEFTGPRPVNGERVKARHAAALAQYKDVTDVLVLPGLIANRKEKRVEVLAESTGLRGGSAAEFLVIDQSSSHGYEALVWSFAKPSDVHAALVFIGLEPGEPFDPGQLRFWGKGSMVDVSVVISNEAPFTIEQLVYDRQHDEEIPASGFIFTGSVVVPVRPGETEPAYGADIYEPKSVLSLFNTPVTVLDVPRQASQGDVYNSHVVNPNHELAGGKLLTLVMVPRPGDGEERVKNLVLDVRLHTSSGDAATAVVGQTVAYLLKSSDGKALVEDATLDVALKALGGLMEQEGALYLSLLFAERLDLKDVRKTCLIMGLLENQGGIRIEPPASGHLYYKAFLPDDRWRERESRPTQPWELHLARKGGSIEASLVYNEQVWGDNSPVPRYDVISKGISTPQDVRAELDGATAEREKAGKPAIPGVLLVFAGTDLSYGELMAFVRPTLSTHSLVHVFLDPLAE